MQNYGLGRGLASLIPQKNKGTQEQKNRETKEQANRNSEEGSMQSKASEIDINLIDSNPHQPRLQIDREKLAGLTQSIKQHGIIQPLVVSQNGSRFELIAGERRFQAAKQAGLSTVPIVIREAKEKEKLELALVENVQRHDLNAIEEARAYKKLTDDFQMSQEEVALRIGKSRSSVANKIRLLGLPVEIQRALAEEHITEGHAKAILAVDNPEKQRALFELIIKQNLTVRQTENKTREISVRPHKRILNMDPQIKELEDKLVGVLGTKVKIVKSGGGGKIIIEYYSSEELSGLLEKLKA